jgi:peptidoglycan/LPS O-acetylase OafA/YrhL
MEAVLPKKTFETMNGLRGLAAILVVVWHGGPDWFGKFVPPASYLAVDLFFVLSGFVVAYSYEQRLARGMTTKHFFVVRLIRLYPLYFLGTLISCAVALSWTLIHLEVGSALAIVIRSIPFAIFMLPTPSWISGEIYGDLYPLNVPAWSLFCELVVNLVYAVSFRFWSIRNLIFIMSISAALMLFTERFGVDQGWGAGGFNWASMPFGLFRVFYSFPAGVLIHRIVHREQFVPPNIGYLTIFAIFPLMFVWHAELACKAIILLGFPLLVAFASTSEPTGPMRYVCAKLGSASYAVYAIHVPLIGFVSLARGKFGLDPNVSYTGGLFLVCIVPLSLLIDRWFDDPVRRILTSRYVSPFTLRERDRLTTSI